MSIRADRVQEEKLRQIGVWTKKHLWALHLDMTGKLRSQALRCRFREEPPGVTCVGEESCPQGDL